MHFLPPRILFRSFEVLLNSIKNRLQYFVLSHKLLCTYSEMAKSVTVVCDLRFWLLDDILPQWIYILDFGQTYESFLLSTTRMNWYGLTRGPCLTPLWYPKDFGEKRCLFIEVSQVDVSVIHILRNQPCILNSASNLVYVP